ncbi:ankyrin repeat domain-containing protein [Leadbettera azotonutricia]|uniref:Ankyrin repeat protein n=1 Tax=Leadbettera azotonutricia (strain ATCC BAA-888 / DSM 13862 / ZAS-9) TaxID=545695 RepID=F5Y9M4_LEAAZ|nr:ankyrin repeat domain-containing protein [Leadbettera azotonutricia]AEF82309.1 ankyrin repeat protein [Leadbettera azotonutricia ZAS-9]
MKDERLEFSIFELRPDVRYWVNSAFDDTEGFCHPAKENWILRGIEGNKEQPVLLVEMEGKLLRFSPEEHIARNAADHISEANFSIQDFRDAYNGKYFNMAGMYEALNKKDVEGYYDGNLYHLAAAFYDAWAINYLQSQGVKPTVDNGWNTPLHKICMSSFGADDYARHYDEMYQCVCLLLDAGVNPQAPNKNGAIAYLEAAQYGIYPLIHALADRGIRMNAAYSEGKNILHYLCNKLDVLKYFAGHIEKVKKMITTIIQSPEAGIDIEARDGYGFTPLDYVQRSGPEAKEIAALFVAAKAGGNSAAASVAALTGGMDIWQAVLHEDPEAVEALLKYGADPNMVHDKDDLTPLQILCKKEPRLPPPPKFEKDFFAIMDLLFAHGADVNRVNEANETTALFWLLMSPYKWTLRVLEYLIERGLDPKVPLDSEGNTSLHVMCRRMFDERMNYLFIEKLLDAGADPNQTNREGLTPLMLYAEHGLEFEQEIAETLLSHGADPGYVDTFGNTALHYAAANYNEASGKRIMGLLFDAGYTDITHVNNAEENALDIAQRNNHGSIVKLLVERG